MHAKERKRNTEASSKTLIVGAGRSNGNHFRPSAFGAVRLVCIASVAMLTFVCILVGTEVMRQEPYVHRESPAHNPHPDTHHDGHRGDDNHRLHKKHGDDTSKDILANTNAAAPTLLALSPKAAAAVLEPRNAAHHRRRSPHAAEKVRASAAATKSAKQMPTRQAT